MRRTKKVEITVETSRIVVRFGVDDDTVWCAVCSAPAQTVTPGEAAALEAANPGVIDRRAGAGRLHLIEKEGSLPLICLRSLLASFDAHGDDDADGHRGHG